MFCTAVGVWAEDQGCATPTVDATTQPVDSGHDSSATGHDAGPPPVDGGRDARHPVDSGHDAGHPVDSGDDGGHPIDSGHDGGHPVDSGHHAEAGHLDGSVTVASCSACSSGEMCIESITNGGACFPHDGDVCSNGATGTCCNTFTTYACHDLPAACAGVVTCACADQYCGHSSPGCVNATVDAGTSRLVLVCEEDDA